MSDRWFEWDENKRILNLAKHGLDFVDAVKIFGGDHENWLSRVVVDEVRWIAVGPLNRLAISVVYTMRTDTTRIISARRAKDEERDEYYKIRSERSADDPRAE